MMPTLTRPRVYLDACIVIYYIARCDAFWTNDDRLRRAADDHLKIVAF